MSNYELLDPEQHKNVKIIDDKSAEYGDDLMFAMTFPYEFRNIQSCYPIFFHKNAQTGAFFPIALFGFQEKENLFLKDNTWDAPYIPLMVRRQPFLIGFQQGDDDEKAAKVTLDMDNPRVNKKKGQALFLEHGGQSEYLIEAVKNLEIIHQSHQHCDKFIEALLEHELLESVTVDVQLNNGSKNQLLGFYTINEEKLQSLKGDALQSLSQQGFLQPMFMAIASQSSLRELINRKNIGLLG